MANDNQTALMQSIQRKKDRLKQLMDSGNSGNINHSGRIRELEFQITEDEKLLSVEKEQRKQDWIEGFVCSKNVHPLAKAEDVYNEKHHNHGK